MLENILIMFIGAFVGWNIPQPVWAKNIQNRIVNSIKKSIS